MASGTLSAVLHQPPQYLISSANIAKAVITLTDIAFSLLPIAFIYKINIPIREKFVLCLLMALGLFASSVVLVRTTTFRRYKRAGDKLWYMSDISIWNLLEGELAIIAACIPYLKNTMERALQKFGFLKEVHGDHGATSVRISGHDYDMEMEAARRRMERRGREEEDADEWVPELTPRSDAHSDGKSLDFITTASTRGWVGFQAHPTGEGHPLGSTGGTWCRD